MLRIIGVQTAFQLKRKRALFVFYILLLGVLIHFIRNVMAFQGTDVVMMIEPMKLLFLSFNYAGYNGGDYLLLVQLYPLLVVAPAGFLLAQEDQTGERVYLTARLGVRRYLISRWMTAFLTTLIIFTVPFLLDILLHALSFPSGATGDFIVTNYYGSDYIECVEHYLFTGLYLFSPVLYVVVMTLIFGLISGLLAAFTAAFSAAFKIKYHLMLFLPVFLFTNMTVLMGSGTPLSTPSLNVFCYLTLFNEYAKYAFYLPILILVLCAASAAMVLRAGRKDCL